MGRKRDRFWNYAEEQGNYYFKCNFCDRVFSGGATRIKAHLAGVSGYDIVACVDVNQDVQKEAQETQKSNKKLKSASSTSSAGKRKITSASKIKDKIVTDKSRMVLTRSMATTNDIQEEEPPTTALEKQVKTLTAAVERLTRQNHDLEEQLRQKNAAPDNQGADQEGTSADRHICIIDCEIAAPKNVGRLTCLRTLPDFCVGRDEGYQIKELGPLKNLRGEINICNLENVEDEEEAKSAKLKEKEILNLELHDEMMLEGLQPHPNLTILTVSCYVGKKLPSWAGLPSLYHNLIEINLSYCGECAEVPTLGQLPCLRVLEMEGMDMVRCIGSEFHFYSDGSYRNTTTKLFPALRILKLENLHKLEEWKDAKELTTADEVLFVFPCLQELTLIKCWKLRDLPDSLHTCVSLQKLVVDRCPMLRSLPGVRSIIRWGIEDPPSGLQYLLPSSTSSIHPSFQKLCLCDSLVVDGIQYFIEMEARLECYTSSVEYMDNGDCLPYSSSIQKLKLCGSLLLLDQIQYFIALKILWIQGFYEMVALPEWLGNLSSLQKLYIVDCNHLVHLPTEEAMRRLTQLETLEIYDCPNLEDDERSKIDHIPFVDIQDSGRPDWSDFEDETNPGSWQEVCIWENN